MRLRPTRWMVPAACIAALAACSSGTHVKGIPSNVPVIGQAPDVHVQAVRSIKNITVKRIAVMPIIEAPNSDRAPGARQNNAVADGSGETITAELVTQMSLDAGWTVVPDSDVEDAMNKLPPTTSANLQQNAIALGIAVSADAVIYGKVEKYKERVGVDYAAASPAAVSFTLYFLDMNTRQVVWTAQFEKTQKALTENVLDLVGFFQNQGRWVRAHEIAMEGVQEAVADLHGQLNLNQNVKHFETGTYESLKSGSYRYDNRPGSFGGGN